MPKPDFLTARAKAEAVARESWHSFTPEGLETYLQDFHTESEHCWVFFRHPFIVLLPEAGLSDWAICVGEIETRLIANLSTEPDLAQRYADLMSRYFMDEAPRAAVMAIYAEYEKRKKNQDI